VALRSKEVFQVKRQKVIGNSVVDHFKARKSTNFYPVIVSDQSSLTLFYFWHFVFASCFVVKKQLKVFTFWLLGSLFLLWKPIDRFSMHSCYEVHAMAHNLSAARRACQFHSLFDVELASKTPTCVDLNAWRGVEITPNRDYRLHPLFCVDLYANTCIALNSKQCTCVTFHLNTSFRYLL